MTNTCMVFAWLPKAFAGFRKCICLSKWRLQCSNRALTLQLSRCLMELNSCTSLKRVTIVHWTLRSWKQELTAANPHGSSHSLLVSTLQLRKWCYRAFFSGLLFPMVIYLYGQTFTPAITILELGELQRMPSWMIHVEDEVLTSDTLSFTPCFYSGWNPLIIPQLR